MEHFIAFHRTILLFFLISQCRTPDIDAKNSKDRTCRQLLDELRKKQADHYTSSSSKEARRRHLGGEDESGSDDKDDDRLGRLEEEREKEISRKEKEREWRERLAEEHRDDFADLYGNSVSDRRRDEEDGRETYDEWADRIYAEFFLKRKRWREHQERCREKPKQHAAEEEPRPSWPPKKLKLALTQDERPSPSDVLQKKYVDFLSKVLEDPEAELTLSSLPFSLSTSQEAIAEVVFRDLGEDKARSRAVIKRALLTWHPDKFEQRYRSRFAPADKDKICEIVVHVSQSLLAVGNIGK